MLSAISPATPIFRTAAETKEASILGPPVARPGGRNPVHATRLDIWRWFFGVAKTSSLPRSEVRHRERVPRAKMHGIM